MKRLFGIILLSCAPILGQTTVYITSNTVWSAATNGGNITVQAIGAGGNGAPASSSTDGTGGGAYVSASIPYTSGASISIQIGHGGGGAAANTIFNTASPQVVAAGGSNASASNMNGGAGGQASSCTPTATAYSGGAGGATTSVGGAGGGGAAGPHGVGYPGVLAAVNGSNGGAADGAYGAEAQGANGGTPPGNGGSGSEWGSYGVGSGGGGASEVAGGQNGGNGGNYGGGGGGAASLTSGGNGGIGGNGLLIITYTPGSVSQPSQPLLTVTSSHIDPFFVGQSNASYTLTVTNAGGQATSGAVTLTETLPSTLTLSSIWGPGWTCSGANCTNSSSVAAGASFPPVFVAVVPPVVAMAAINQVSVSGGGSVAANASDGTNIVAATSNCLTITISPSRRPLTAPRCRRRTNVILILRLSM